MRRKVFWRTCLSDGVGLSEEEDVVSHFQIAFEYTYVVLDHVIDRISVLFHHML